ncbi:MAG TPA: signal peptidase II [Gemmatimonadaceae bacterium]|nr:signal peptidase II [Gemmatimonadaceae bacterium]
MSHKARLFWPLAFLLVLTDCATKEYAVEQLRTPHAPREVLGDVLQLTLTYNQGAAFGIHLGPWSRPLLLLLGFAVLAVLFGFYHRTQAGDRAAALALACVCGGAVGNLLDRLRSERGVVDFIDIGVGTVRFWTFNLADVAIAIGALLLAGILWKRAPVLGADVPPAM